MIKPRNLFALAVVIALGVLPLVAQQQQEDRVKAIGGKFLCMCGCSRSSRNATMWAAPCPRRC